MRATVVAPESAYPGREDGSRLRADGGQRPWLQRVPLPRGNHGK